MTFNMTRRALLGFGGGAAVGIALSPAPWKLIDDLGIWTQNWKWIPRPPHGPVTVRTSSCSLCPAGCAVQARCIGGSPVAMRAIADDAIGAGALCPLGQTGHHLRFHPSRLTSVVKAVHKNGIHSEKITNAAAAADVARALRTSGTVAVLDLRPGRSASWGWRRLMAELPDGIVIDAPGREGASLQTLRGMLQGDAPAVGVDLEHARAILSFGAPLAEGWGAPRVTARILRRQKGELHLVQVDPTRTATAAAADRWLAARPGTEAILALAIGHVLLAEGLATADAVKSATDVPQYLALVARFTPAVAAGITGVPAEAIAAAAREIGSNLPAVVVAGEDAGGRFGEVAETAMLGLNGLLSVTGGEGGLMVRRELPAPFADTKLAAVRELHEVRDGSVTSLFIDASDGESIVPWPLVAKKLAPNARVIAMSPYFAGLALRADVVVPAAPFLERTHEIPTPFDATRPMLALTATIASPLEGSIDPLQFVRKAFEAASLPVPSGWTTSEELIRARVAAVHASGDGEVIALADGSTTPVSAIASPDDFWTALTDGGRWQGSASPSAAPLKWALLGRHEAELARLADAPRSEGLLLVLRAPRDVTSSSAHSPLLAKLYQESALRRSEGTAALNPRTVRQLRLRAGRLARLETEAGSVDVMIAADQAVMPGVVELTVGPDPSALGSTKLRDRAGVLDICTADANGVWRSAPAKLVEA